MTRVVLQATIMIGYLMGVFSYAASGQAISGAHVQYGIVYNDVLNRYEVTYQTNSMAPTMPATTMTAQVFIVFSDMVNGSTGTPDGLYNSNSFTINTSYNNGNWEKGDYINGPVENPGKDYLGFYLASTGTNDIELDTVNKSFILFTFTIEGPCPGSLAILEESDPFHFDPFEDFIPNSLSLNINNNFDVIFPRSATLPTSWWIPGYIGNFTSGTGDCMPIAKKGGLDSKSLQMDVDNIKIYPNPAKNYVKIASPNMTNADVYVYTTDGRKVLVLRNHDLSSGMDVRKLSSGNYYLKISNGANVYMHRLTVVH